MLRKTMGAVKRHTLNPDVLKKSNVFFGKCQLKTEMHELSELNIKL